MTPNRDPDRHKEMLLMRLETVGKRIPKIDAADKATGRARYIQDLTLPGMLYGRILYSKYAHARIVKINTEKARRCPGCAPF